MKIFHAYRKKILLGVSILLAAAMITFGGGKLLIYFIIAFTSLIVGYKFKSAKQVYDDYKLSLRINSVFYSAKQTEALQAENERLKQDLAIASQRAQIYQNNQPRGGFNHVDHSGDGLARFR